MMKIDCNFEAIEKLNHHTLSLFRSFDPSSAELPLATKTSGEMSDTDEMQHDASGWLKTLGLQSRVSGSHPGGVTHLTDSF